MSSTNFTRKILISVPVNMYYHGKNSYTKQAMEKKYLKFYFFWKNSDPLNECMFFKLIVIILCQILGWYETETYVCMYTMHLFLL